MTAMTEANSYVRLILLGEAGVGKSATGNFILRRNAFASRNHPGPFTQDVESHSIKLDNRIVTVIDTPGLPVTKENMLPTLINIQSSLDFVQHGPYCFLLVIKLGKLLEMEDHTTKLLKMMFGTKVLEHTILVFTHEDDAAVRGKNIEDLVYELEENESLKALFHDCGRRYITLNNYEPNEEIRQERLQKVMIMVDGIARDWKGYYEESICVYRRVLQKYAEDWNGNCFNAEQMGTIMQEQEQESRKHTILSSIVGAVAGAGIGLLGVATYAAGPAAVGALTAAVPVIAKHFK